MKVNFSIELPIKDPERVFDLDALKTMKGVFIEEIDEK